MNPFILKLYKIQEKAITPIGTSYLMNQTLIADLINKLSSSIKILRGNFQ